MSLDEKRYFSLEYPILSKFDLPTDKCDKFHVL